MKSKLVKSKRIFVPAGKHKAYYRTDPRTKKPKDVLTYEEAIMYVSEGGTPETRKILKETISYYPEKVEELQDKIRKDEGEFVTLWRWTKGKKLQGIESFTYDSKIAKEMGADLELDVPVEAIVAHSKYNPKEMYRSRFEGEVLVDTSKLSDEEFEEKVEGGFDYDRWAMGSRAPKRTKKMDPETEASIRKLFGKANDFVIDTKKSRKHLVDLRKSKLEGKKVPYRLNGHVVWSKVYKGGFIVKGKPERVDYNSRVLLKSGIGFVTGIGKNGITARDKSGKKHQVFYKNLNLWVK
jgi:hypothetical protein